MRRVRVGPLKAEFITYEVRKLALDIRKADDRSEEQLDRALRWSAEGLARRWRTNARKTARRHGRHYPKAIGYDILRQGRVAEVGPDALHPKGQGGMAFEYGSRNQPPHLDGNRAMDDIEPLFMMWAHSAAKLDL